MISKYFVEFIFFSFIGWIWETIYCTLTNKKWERRGFLFGPICPIYGVGAISVFIMLDILKALNMPVPEWWVIFIISFFGSAVLEYSTSVILEKLFHAYWWDYSNMPLNINGRICLPASLGFSFAGILIVYVIYPFFERLVMFISPICFELSAFILLIIFTLDITLTVTSLTDIQKKIESVDDNINIKMSETIDSIYSSTTNLSRSTVARIRGVRFKKPTQTDLYQKLIERIKKG